MEALRLFEPLTPALSSEGIGGKLKTLVRIIK
jgi:hypothetical protein